MRPTIGRLHELTPDLLAALVAESERSGLRFLHRLVADWASGANRFDGPGEALFVARVGGRVVGMCGLNIDPYIAGPHVGRLRHLYVLSAHRRRGIGRQLVAAVLEAARGVFDRLRLRTENAQAARFYEALAFRPRAGQTACTHVLELRVPFCDRETSAVG